MSKNQSLPHPTRKANAAALLLLLGWLSAISSSGAPLPQATKDKLERASIYTLVYNGDREAHDVSTATVFKKRKGDRGVWYYLAVTTLDKPSFGNTNYSLRRPESEPRPLDRLRGHDATTGLAFFEFSLRDSKNAKEIAPVALENAVVPQPGDALHVASIELVPPGKIFPERAEVLAVEVVSLVNDAAGQLQWIEVAGDLRETLKGGAALDSKGNLVGIFRGPGEEGTTTWRIMPAANLIEMSKGRLGPMEFEIQSFPDKVTLNLRGGYWNPLKDLPSVRLLLADGATLHQKPGRDEAGNWRPIDSNAKQIHFDYTYSDITYARTLPMPADGQPAKFYGQLVERRRDKPDRFLEPFELNIRREEGRWVASGVGVVPAVPGVHKDVRESKEPVVRLGEAEVIDLPSRLRDVYLAHGGDQLVLVFADNPCLAVFDLPSRKIIASAELDTPRISIAASRDSVYTGNWDSGIIERRDLASLESTDTTMQLPAAQKLISIGAGWDAVDTPVFAVTTAGPSFLDPVTLKPIPDISAEGAHFNYERNPLDKGEHYRQARASGDGAAFLHWFHTGRDRKVALCYLHDGRLFLANTQDSSGARLGRHGDFLFGAGGGIMPVATSLEEALRSEYRSALRMPRAGFPFPSLEGTTFLTYHPGRGGFREFSTRPMVALHARMADCTKKIATLDGFGELVDLNSPFGPPREKRLLFLPEAGVIVTIPNDLRRMFIHSFDPAAALAEHKILTPALRSLPRRWVARGETVTHDFASYTSPLLFTYDLIDGPEGATLERDGRFRWVVPAGLIDQKADVRMRVRSAKDHEAIHTFRFILTGGDPLVAVDAPPGTPPLCGDPTTIKLGKSGRPVVGGGGRYLVIPGKDDATVRVFDFKSRSIVASEKLAADDFLLTANRDALFVFIKTPKILERRKLPSLEREKVRAAGGVIRGMDIAIGAHSRETPLVLAGSTRLRFFDPKSLDDVGLKLYENDRTKLEGRLLGNPMRMRAAADGRSMIVWGTTSTTAYPYGLRLFGNRVALTSTTNSFPPSFSPGFTEATSYSLDGITLDEAFNRSQQDDSTTTRPALIPGLSGYTYLAVNLSPRHTSNREKPIPTKITIHSASGNQRLLAMSNFRELDTNADELRQRYRRTGIEERVFYSPEFATLVTMPDDEQIVVRELPLEASLQKIGRPFAFVKSTPPPRFARGKRFSHQIEISSSTPGPPQFSLLEGPDGMEINGDGLITWQVPEDAEGRKQNVVVEIRAANGQQLYSRFDIHLDKAPPPLTATGKPGS